MYKIDIIMTKIPANAIFIDIDGTLLDEGFGTWAKLSQENAKHISEVAKKVPVVLATGRSSENHIFHLMDRLNIQYAICFNGSQIIDINKETIFEIKLDNKIMKDIAYEAIKHKLTFSINSVGGIYGKTIKPRLISWFSQFYPSHYEKADFSSDKSIHKLLIIGFSKKRITKFHKYLVANYPQLSSVIVGKNYAIEITDINATKGIAEHYLATQILKIDPQKAVHIGDSMNDATTKGKIGHLIAMANASKELKKIADHVSTFNRKKAGLSKILKEELQIIV